MQKWQNALANTQRLVNKLQKEFFGEILKALTGFFYQYALRKKYGKCENQERKKKDFYIGDGSNFERSLNFCFHLSAD